MWLYRECKNAERALLHHTQNALELKYIEPLLNNNTGLIEDELPTVLRYLDQNYGKVQSEEVKQKEDEVLSLSFNPRWSYGYPVSTYWAAPETCHGSRNSVFGSPKNRDRSLFDPQYSRLIESTRWMELKSRDHEDVGHL